MGKKYFVRNPDTGLVLDVKGGNAVQGAEICLWGAHGGDNQLWKFKDGMLYSIKNKKLCMDVNQSTKGVCLWTPHGGANQKWTFHDDKTCHSGLGNVMDIRAGRKDAGAALCVWAKHGGSNQHFVLEEH